MRTEDCIPLAAGKKRRNQTAILAQQHPVLLIGVDQRTLAVLKDMFLIHLRLKPVRFEARVTRIRGTSHSLKYVCAHTHSLLSFSLSSALSFLLSLPSARALLLPFALDAHTHAHTHTHTHTHASMQGPYAQAPDITPRGVESHAVLPAKQTSLETYARLRDSSDSVRVV